jgi:hypothetical protein
LQFEAILVWAGLETFGQGLDLEKSGAAVRQCMKQKIYFFACFAWFVTTGFLAGLAILSWAGQ